MTRKEELWLDRRLAGLAHMRWADIHMEFQETRTRPVTVDGVEVHLEERGMEGVTGKRGYWLAVYYWGPGDEYRAREYVYKENGFTRRRDVSIESLPGVEARYRK